MNPTKLFPLIITDKLAETKAFYTEQAGFVVTIEQGDYLQLRHGEDESAPELCFMKRSDSAPMGPMEAFGGKGLILSIPTQSADDKHDALRTQGAEIVAEPADKPWGWRSFVAVDPNGVLLDFFHVCDDSAIANAAS